MRGVLGVAVFQVLLGIFLLIGWVVNIVKFAGCDFEAPLKTEIVRGVGIAVAPVGGIIGWLDIGEEKE